MSAPQFPSSGSGDDPAGGGAEPPGESKAPDQVPPERGQIEINAGPPDDHVPGESGNAQMSSVLGAHGWQQ